MKQNTSGLSIHRADDNSTATAKPTGSEDRRVNARKPRWFFKARNNVEAREREAGETLCRDVPARSDRGQDGEPCPELPLTGDGGQIASTCSV